jgi:hypothetical protein
MFYPLSLEKYLLNKIELKLLQTLFLGLLIGATFASMAIAQNNDKLVKEQIQETLEILDEAMVSRTYETLDKYYAADLNIIAPNGMILERNQLLAPFKDSTKQSALIKVSREEVTMVIKKNYVYITSKVTHVFEGREDRVYENLQLFKKDHAVWQLKLLHSSLLSN